MEKAARAVGRRFCVCGGKPSRTSGGTARALGIASLKPGHNGLYGVHQAEAIAAVEPAVMNATDHTRTARRNRETRSAPGTIAYVS